jgi:hypothetical protein
MKDIILVLWMGVSCLYLIYLDTKIKRMESELEVSRLDLMYLDTVIKRLREEITQAKENIKEER